MAILVFVYDTTTGGFKVQKVGSAQISDGAIVSGKIGLLAVGTPHLASRAVTSAKIGALAVGTPHIAALAIVSGKVASGGLSPLSSGKIWAGFTGNIPREENKPATVPTGLIAMWHGTIANIPSGWVICDGNNSTPNLLAKFVEGVATAATDPGATGGATSKTTGGHIHTQSAHGHTQNAHDHLILVNRGVGQGGAEYAGSFGYKTSTTVATNQSSTPGIQSNTDSISDIRPLFYDIAFIMKT